MKTDFPEITSFGTLFAFAEAMEEGILQLCEKMPSLDGEGAAGMAGEALRRHSKRLKKIQRLRQERLNEVVLQPLSGMDRERYAPDLSLELRPAAEVLALSEEKAALFYEDAAEKASSVLGGVERTLRKLAEESREMATAARSVMQPS